MRFLFLAVILSIHAINSFSQTKALTETGREVILYKDGTWKYQDESQNESSEITENKTLFKKDKNSTFLVKSSKLNIGVYINPSSWTFSKGKGEDAFEFQFEKKGGDLYGILISEKTSVPIESMKEIAIENAREVAPDIEVTREEYRNVNGLRVLLMQMSGTTQGVSFTYYGYYYSNPKGTIQLLTYTAQNLFDEYQEDMEKLLNGLVELK